MFVRNIFKSQLLVKYSIYISYINSSQLVCFFPVGRHTYSLCVLQYIVSTLCSPSSAPLCLSRSFSVCSGFAKVSCCAAGPLQPWVANWPGNVCSPVPPPTVHISVSINHKLGVREGGSTANSVPTLWHLDVESFQWN